MYLNLDLLYNIDTYLYPLFYYSDRYDLSEVYSPMSLKSIYFFRDEGTPHTIYFDYLNLNFKKGEKIHLFLVSFTFNFTKEKLIFNQFVLNNSSSFKLKKQDILFLKSNKRID